MANPVEVVILAAGQGTRMRSALPKVLHKVGGKPMLQHVIDTAATLDPRTVHVVVRPDAPALQENIAGVNWVMQKEQLGTSHAVGQALPDVGEDAVVLVAYGDVPLVRPQTLEACAAAAQGGQVGLVTADFEDPAELGRIVRENGAIQRIVEFKDASDKERAITEINSGILAARKDVMVRLMDQVGNDNAQGEYYLTDIIGLAVEQNIGVVGVKAVSEAEVTGVNNRAQLAEVERAYQAEQVTALMAAGVTMADPDRVDIRGQVTVGQDVTFDINVVLQGEVEIGAGCTIGVGAVITNAKLGEGVNVEPYTVIEDAEVADNCNLGPFARIRPGTQLAEGVRIGNFVETKKSTLGPGSKANHLAYIGDATIGADCNIGAGTITCNYDGVNKHPTVMGDGVFIGSNSTLVAPLKLGDQAYTAAGSTITKTVEDDQLAIGRGRQKNIDGWVAPARRPKE